MRILESDLKKFVDGKQYREEFLYRKVSYLEFCEMLGISSKANFYWKAKKSISSDLIEKKFEFFISADSKKFLLYFFKNEIVFRIAEFNNEEIYIDDLALTDVDDIYLIRDKSGDDELMTLKRIGYYIFY